MNWGAVALAAAVMLAAGAGLYWFELRHVPPAERPPGMREGRRAARTLVRWLWPAALLLALWAATRTEALWTFAFPLFWMLTFLVFFAAVGTLVLLAPLALYAAVNGARRRSVVQFVLGMCIVVTSSFLVDIVVMGEEERDLARWCKRMEPVAGALEAYARDHGAPPDSLAELVPTYLGGLPRRTSPRFGPLEYERVAAEDTLLTWVHYPLGPRLRGQYEFDVPMLSARAGVSGRLSQVLLEPEGERWGREPFDARAWRDSLPARARMARTAAALFGPGAPLDSLLERLGPPESRFSRSQPLWQLRAEYDRGFSSDWVVRVPNERQPTDYYDEHPERVGRWWRFSGGD
ncbi:MAG: hypothetical protein U0704_05520 [Candidatus Eisenbacteria bacterium]